MNYILLVLFVGALVLLLWARHHRLQSNYDKHVFIASTLVLANGSYRRRRGGSVIFELERHDPLLRSVIIHSVKGASEDVRISNFDQLFLNIDDANKYANPICSISVVLANKALQRFEDKKKYVHIGGKLRFVDGKEKSFAKKLFFTMAQTE